jgi:hypothetical protein
MARAEGGQVSTTRDGATYIAQDMEAMWEGGETARFHTCTMLRPDTVGQHSYGVACVMMHVYPAAPARLLRACLKHDMAEQFTGDMPSPAKRGLGIREQFAAYEDEFLDSVGIGAEPLSAAQAWLLKFCDSADGTRVCIRERSMGNRRIEFAYGNFNRYLDELLVASKAIGDLVADAEYAEVMHRCRQLVWALKKEWEIVSK